jgi:hypothetical protein
MGLKKRIFSAQFAQASAGWGVQSLKKTRQVLLPAGKSSLLKESNNAM